MTGPVTTRLLALLVAVVSGSDVARATQSSPPPPSAQVPPAQFRAGVDLMRIDVTVLDKRTRKPVRGLKAEDFEVKVGGQPQAIQAVAELNTGGHATAGSAWQTDAARDVVTNNLSATRLIVILMDDASGGLWHRQAAKKVAHKIIDELGADDLAAVVFVNKTDRSQDFTADRNLLRAAADSFDPLANPRWGSPNALGTLMNVRRFLGTMAKYRRAIMLVTSEGYALDGGLPPLWLRNAGLEDGDNEVSASPSFEVGSRLGHVPIYFFTTFGLTVSTNPRARAIGEDTITYARAAGGRAIIENNAPETEVTSVLEELGLVYTLAYAPAFPLDGKNRFADIKVNRPDVLVLPSSGAFRTARELNNADARQKLNVVKGFTLLDAIAAPLMGGSLPLRLSTMAMAVAREREQAVAVTLGLPAPDAAAGPQQYGLTLVVYDGEGRQQISSSKKTVTVTPGGGSAGAPAEVLLRLDLRPGRYNIRVGAQLAGGGAAGSVFTSVVVPDFAKEALSLSGVAIGRAEGRPIGGRESLSALLPFAPTVVREFSASDHVGALVRVHQTTGRATALRLDTQILDAGGAVVVSQSTPVHESAFFQGRAVEHRYEVPVSTLAPGEYLLRFVATAAGRDVTRDVRFSIR